MAIPIRRGEPTYEWLREQAQKRLLERFPDLKTAIESGEFEDVITGFVANALGAYNIPMLLDIYDDADQWRLLKEAGFKPFEFPEPEMDDASWLYHRRLLEKDYKRAKNLLLCGLDVETDDAYELNRLFFEKHGRHAQSMGP